MLTFQSLVCYRSETGAKFPALEKLIANDNRLGGDDVFVALAGLPLSVTALPLSRFCSVTTNSIVLGSNSF